MKRDLTKLLLAATVCATSVSAHAQSTLRQTGNPTPAGEPALDGDDVIVVTARRKDERLRDVPATVTVLTRETLAATGATVAADFVNLTSGVTIQTGTTEPSDTSINIRGLNGARDAEGNVALVVDGILKTSMAALNSPQGAISQVEILKGPQGAIYGRNASAGAIVITTRKPSDRLEGEIKAIAATDDTYSATGLLSGPLSENLGFVVSAEYARSDGFFRNTFLSSQASEDVYPGYSRNGASIDNYERISTFGRLNYDDGDTRVDLKADYTYNRSGAISHNAVFQIPALAAAFSDPIFNAPVSDHKFLFTNNTEAKGWQKIYGASLRFDQDLSLGTLVATAAYNRVHNDYIAGGTSGAFGFFNNEPNCIRTRAATATGVVNQEPFNRYAAAFGFAQPYSPSTCDSIQGNRRWQKDISTEVRLIGPTGGAFQWQLGANYIFIDRRVCINLTLDTGLGGERKCFSRDPRFPTEGLQDDTFRTNVYAAFASADYAASEKLKLGLALRYDIEARKTSNNIPRDVRTRWVGNPLTGFPNGTATTPANYYLNPGLDPAYNPSGVIAPRSETFKQLEPKISIAYKPSPATTLYASWGIGFKAGGFNSGGTSTIVDRTFNRPVAEGGINAGISVPDTYRKETNSAYEAGIKGSLFRRLDYEVVGFYTDVKNMQFFEFFVGNFGFLRSISNIDKVRLKGIEASLNYRVSDEFTVFASGNVMDTKIVKNSARPYTVGNKSPSTPEYTANFGAQLKAPMSDLVNFFARTDVRLTGSTPFHPVQDNTVPTTFGFDANFKNSTRDPYATINLRGGLEIGRLSLTAFVTNLLNEHFLEDLTPAPEFGGDFISPGERRRIGVEARMTF